MGGSVGQSSSQQQTQAAPPPWAAAAGQQAMQAAQSLQQMPFRISPQPIAPLQAQQAEAFQSVENLQGAYTPFADIGAMFQMPQGASQYFGAESAGVLPELENIFGQQMAQTTGDLVNKAGGPDAERIAVAQGELANQQGIAAGQTLSQLMGQAVGQGQSAGTNLASIGQTGQNMAQGAAQAELSAGTLQQQQLQNQQNALYQNQLQAISWPFQTTGFLSEVAAGLTPSMGGTMNQQGQMKSSSLGGSLGGLGGMGKGASGGRVTGGIDKDIVAQLHGRLPKKASGGGVPESFGKGGSTNNGPDPGTIDQGAALPLSGPPGYFPSWVATPGAEQVPPGADPWKYGAIGEGAYLFPTQASYASGAGPPVMPDRNPWLGGGPAQWPSQIPTLENAYNIDVGNPQAAAQGVASGLFKANSPQAYGAEKQVFGSPQYGQQTGFADITPTSDYGALLMSLMNERSSLTSQLSSGDRSAIPGEAQLPVSQQQARPQFSARGGRAYADGGRTPEGFKGGGATSSPAPALPPNVAGTAGAGLYQQLAGQSAASPFSPINWPIGPGNSWNLTGPTNFTTSAGLPGEFLFQPGGNTPFGGTNTPAGTASITATTNDPYRPKSWGSGQFYSPYTPPSPQTGQQSPMTSSMASAASQAAPTFGVYDLFGSGGGKGGGSIGGSNWGGSGWGGSQGNMQPWMTPATANTPSWSGARGGRAPMQGGGLPGGVGGGQQAQQQAAGMQVPSLTSTPSGVSFMPGQGQVVSDPNIKPGPQGIKPKLGPPPPAPKPPEQGGGGKGGKGKKGGQGQQDQSQQDQADDQEADKQDGSDGGGGGTVGTKDPGASGPTGSIGDPGIAGASGALSSSSPGQPFGGVGGMQGGTSPFGLSGLESMDAGAGGAGGGMGDMSAMADAGGGSDFGGGGMKGGEARGGAIRGYDDGGDTGGDFGGTSAADAFDAFDAGMYTTGLGDSPGPGFAPHPDSGGPGIGGEQGRRSTAPAPQTPFSGPPGGGAAYGFGSPWNMGRMQQANAASTWAPTNNVPDAGLAGTGSGHSLSGERQASPSPPTPVPAPAAGPGPSPSGASGTTSRPLDRNPGDPIIAPQVTQAWDAIKRNAPTWLHNAQGPQTVFGPGAGTPFGQRWPDTVSRETSPKERQIDDTNAAIAKAAGLQGYGGGSPTQQQAPPGQQPSAITPTGTERAIGQQVLANAMRGHPHTGWTPQGWVQAGPTRGDPMHVASAAVPLPSGDPRRQPVGEPVTPWQTQPTALTPTDTERAMGHRDLAQAMSAVPQPGQGYGGGAAEPSLAQVQGPGGQQWASMKGDREKALELAQEPPQPTAETPAQPAALHPAGTEPRTLQPGNVPLPLPRPWGIDKTVGQVLDERGTSQFVRSMVPDQHLLMRDWAEKHPDRAAVAERMFPEAAAERKKADAIKQATQLAQEHNARLGAAAPGSAQGNSLMPPERFAPQRTDNVLTSRDTQALRQGAAPGQTAMPRVVERPPGTVPNMPDNLPNNAVGHAIHNAATRYGLNPRFMAAVARIESAFVPSSNYNRATQYKGLFQMGRDEWRQYGQGRDIYDAEANADAASRMMRDHVDRFRNQFGRDPTPGEAYLIHQQGFGWHTGVRIPANHITGNPYPGMRGPQTHESFTNGWSNRVNQLMGRQGDDTESPAEFSSVRFASGGPAHFDDGGDTDDASFSDRFGPSPVDVPSKPDDTEPPAQPAAAAPPPAPDRPGRFKDATTPAEQPDQTDQAAKPVKTVPVSGAPSQPVPGSVAKPPPSQAAPTERTQRQPTLEEINKGRRNITTAIQPPNTSLWPDMWRKYISPFIGPLVTGDPAWNFKLNQMERADREGKLNSYFHELEYLTNHDYHLPGITDAGAAAENVLGRMDGVRTAVKGAAALGQGNLGPGAGGGQGQSEQAGQLASAGPGQAAAARPAMPQQAQPPLTHEQMAGQAFERMWANTQHNLSNPITRQQGIAGLAALQSMATNEANRERIRIETAKAGIYPYGNLGYFDLRDVDPQTGQPRFHSNVEIARGIRDQIQRSGQPGSGVPSIGGSSVPASPSPAQPAASTPMMNTPTPPGPQAQPSGTLAATPIPAGPSPAQPKPPAAAPAPAPAAPENKPVVSHPAFNPDQEHAHVPQNLFYSDEEMALNPERAKAKTTEAYKFAQDQVHKDYQVAGLVQDFQQTLEEVRGNKALLSGGPGAHTRAHLVAIANKISELTGAPTVNEKELSTLENANRAGASLTMGAIRGMGGVGRSPRLAGLLNEAIPSTEMSPDAARRAVFTMQQLIARDTDYARLMDDWIRATGGSVTGFDEWFNDPRSHPVEMYTRRAQAQAADLPYDWVEKLRQNPDRVGTFEQKLPGLGRYILHGATP